MYYINCCKEFYSSIRYDGSSSIYLINPETNKFKVCSWYLELSKVENNNFNDITKKYNKKNKLLKIRGIYAIKKEVFCLKIKGYPLKAHELTITVFPVKNIKDYYCL